jgi:hypothetical protein
LAKEGLARSFKYLAYTHALSGFNDGIEVDERPAQFPGKKLADSGFAAAHEPEEINLFASVPAHWRVVDYSRVDESRVQSSVESREAELKNQEVAEPSAEVG